MAASAYSTIVSAAHHRLASTARSVSVGDKVQTPSGIGAIMLNGPVFFDANRYPQIGDEAVVILHGGQLAVREIVQGYTPPGPGLVYVNCDEPFPGSFNSKSLVALVGVVIDPLS